MFLKQKRPEMDDFERKIFDTPVIMEIATSLKRANPIV